MELEKLIKRMLVEDPFYGFMVTTLERKVSREVETAGVHFTKRMTAELIVNPDFFDTLTEDQQMAILKHELLHLAFHHLTMRDTFPDRDIFGKAADMEVNCYIDNLPADHIDHKDFGLPPKQGTMFYYRAIRDWMNQQPQNSGGCGNPSGPCNGGQGGNGNGQGQGQQGQQQPHGQTPQPSIETVDDHSVWNNIPKEEQELMDTMIDDIVLRTAQACKSRGHVPAELQDTIARLEKPFKRVYDWKRAFRRFLGNSYSEKKKTSRRKESRRFIGAAGRKHLKRASVLVAVDTSGSVQERELLEFASELTYMQKSGAYIHILECDAAITDEYDYKPGCLTKVSGRGGTDFEPVIDYYRKRYKMYDTLVYFTDGYSSVDLNIPQNNILWVISSEGARKEYPGKVIYIPKPEENE